MSSQEDDNTQANTNTNGNNNSEVEEVDIAQHESALDALNMYIKDLNEFKSTFHEFIKRGKDIKKRVEKEMKDLKKNTKRKRTRKPDAKPGGFVKPMKMSDQMCEYLEIPKGTKLPRTQVAKKLNEKIRKQKLQNENDRRIIEPNDELEALFSDDYFEKYGENAPLNDNGEKEKLTFFAMQKYIKHHYPKEDTED